MQPLFDYRFASGWNVSLAALNNVETHLGAHNRRAADDTLQRVGIASTPLDAFPVRTRLWSGRERGDGIIDHAWVLVLATLGYQWFEDQYWSGGTVVSVKWTIYTRVRQRGEYARYNCWASLPSERRGDIEMLPQSNMLRIRVQLLDLTPSS